MCHADLATVAGCSGRDRARDHLSETCWAVFLQEHGASLPPNQPPLQLHGQTAQSHLKCSPNVSTLNVR